MWKIRSAPRLSRACRLSPSRMTPDLSLRQMHSLTATAPPHRCYVLLHSPIAPQELPAKGSGSIQRALLLRVGQWGGAVNLAWSPEQVLHETSQGHDPQAYFATAFSSGGRIEIPEVTLANVDEVNEMLREHAKTQGTSPGDIYLYVCTHGPRDCRCGETGGAVVKALQEEVAKRSANSKDPNQRIKVIETAHVGGHKYAANLLIYPHGEWLGLVHPEDVSAVLDEILLRPAVPFGPDDRPIAPKHWRGRMGLSKGEQVELFSRYSD